MRPAEFTPESIIQAGEALLSAGRNITGFALRQKVGGGNPSRLKQVWDEHQSSQTTSVAEPVAELPEDVAEAVANVSKSLTERIAALAVELNDRAVKAADRRVHEVVRSAGEQRAQAERELADAAETVDDLESKLDEAQAAGQVLETKLAESQATGQSQAVELAQIRERLTVTEQTATVAAERHAAEVTRMIAAADTERSRHQAETAQVRAELDRAQAEIQRQREELAQVQTKTAADILAAHAATDAVRTDLVKIQAKVEAADQAHQEQRKTAEREALRTAERIAKAEAEQVQATKEARTAREDAAKLRGQVEALQTQAAELLRALSDRQPMAESQQVVAKAAKLPKPKSP